jgi:hypothetical protein
VDRRCKAREAQTDTAGKVALPSKPGGRMSWDVIARANHVNRVTSPLDVRTMLHLLWSAAGTRRRMCAWQRPLSPESGRSARDAIDPHLP